MPDNVTKLVIPPKSMREMYKKHQIVVTYLPQTNEWQWEVEFTTRMTFNGEEKTVIKAIEKARKRVDQLMGE